MTEEKKPDTTIAPLLYDLTSLQREAANRYGFSAKRTLQLAQECYEKHKVLTYPRTDSRYLPEDYLERFAASYRHILNIDTHRPWTDGAVRGLVERIAPDYLVHELCAHDRASRAAAVRRQNLALGS